MQDFLEKATKTAVDSQHFMNLLGDKVPTYGVMQQRFKNSTELVSLASKKLRSLESGAVKESTEKQESCN